MWFPLTLKTPLSNRVFFWVFFFEKRESVKFVFSTILRKISQRSSFQGIGEGEVLDFVKGWRVGGRGEVFAFLVGVEAVCT